MTSFKFKITFSNGNSITWGCSAESKVEAFQSLASQVLVGDKVEFLSND